ncbi:hypothetical protein CHH80_10770 [Bacillus sp. 7504-2]|nr:hypothetical protein CHH80_10770 [Bacillus sp. 7504-2]
MNILKEKFLEEATTPLAKKVGNTISSIWTIVFGNIDIYAEKKEFQRQLSLQSFKDDLERKVSSIPADKLTEPPLHVLGPTLEASKFYFENQDLRSMFANLIASSINIDKTNDAHPSFVEIIKQLHPDEAKIIKYFSDRGFPLLDVLAVFDNGGRMHFTLNFSDIAEKAECVAPLSIGSYIDNLSRLGLIAVENNALISPQLYDSLLEHPVITEAKHRATFIGNKEPIVVKKHFRVTPFGIQFYRTCCVQYEHTTEKQVEE